MNLKTSFRYLTDRFLNFTAPTVQNLDTIFDLRRKLCRRCFESHQFSEI